VLFILDAYEALASDRVYRKAMGKKRALEEIRKNANTQFDPYLVDLFLKEMADKEISDKKENADDPPPDRESDITEVKSAG
jgi:HD-GYP domain-containing protein (c-di-GMP phosphodiesterase class II)